MTAEVEIVAVDWLAFTPAYTSHRGGLPVLGAHAFEPEGGDGQGAYSLCGYVERGRTRGVATQDARRCKLCERVFKGTAKPPSRWTSLPRGFKP